ncbi:MAG: hypothetical protein RXR41_02340 [Candidatus Marsarchaeota archaeon]
MSYLPTAAGIGGMLLAFVIGLLVGLIVKKVLSLGLLLFALVLLLLAVGYIHPASTAALLSYLKYYGPEALSAAQKVASLIPYSSIFFIIGFIIGVWKG